MSVVQRIYFGMGAMIALIIVVSGFATFQTNSLAKTFQENRATTSQSLLATDMLDNLFAARLAAAHFRLNQDLEQLATFQDKTADVVTLETELFGLMDGYSGLESLAETPAMLEEYQASMRQAYELQQRRNVLVENATTVVEKARNQLSEI